MRRGWRATREGAKACHWTVREVFGCRVGAATCALGTHGRHLGHLMGLLLGVEHHLLVRPLGELSVGGVVIGHLALLWMGGVGMHGVGLLMGILIEGGVELLWGLGPWGGGLLLLDGVGVRLLLGHGGRRVRMVVCGRGALTGSRGGIDGVCRGRVHVMISRWMPVLRGKNGHGLRAGRKRLELCCQTRGRTEMEAVVGGGRDGDGRQGLDTVND